jgi:hypothetical protein
VEIGVWGLGFWVWGLGSGVQGLGVRVLSLGFRGSGKRALDSGFGVWIWEFLSLG